MSTSIRKAVSYFPVRYHLCAVFVFFLLLNTADLINNTQERMIFEVLTLVGVPTSISNSNLYLGDLVDASKVTLPSYLQLLFLGFFPIIAITARTNGRTRLKLLGFGILTFFAFVASGITAIGLMHVGGIIESALTYRLISLGLTIVVGSIMIELALFSIITIPKPSRIAPAIKRNYSAEYGILFLLLIAGGVLVYSVVSFLDIDLDSPITDFVLLVLWLSTASMITLAYYIANVAFEARRRWHLRQLAKREAHKIRSTDNPAAQPKSAYSVTFLIPAYNEEALVVRCIESVDKAASRYEGRVDIVVVNDGSTDRTEYVVRDALQKLKHCTGQVFTTLNSGKGNALAFGLPQAKGDVIFRTDADSEIDEYALAPMMRHFNDPAIGSVCAWVLPLRQGKGVMWRFQNLLFSYYVFTKKAQDSVDSIITQPGPSTAFRREAILKAGGWVDNIFGEDGEITNRLARLGYREVFEAGAIVYSELPATLVGFMQQRARWSVAFFHSRGRNLRLLGEFRTPRSLVFLWNLITHGSGLGKSLILPFLVAAILTGAFDFAAIDTEFALLTLAVKLAAIQVSIVVIQLALYGYQLAKIHRLRDLWFYPLIRGVNLLLNVAIKPQVLDVLLGWSIRWNKYDTESFKALRRAVNKSIDPLYPSGDVPAQTAKSPAHGSPRKTSEPEPRSIAE